ncbi:MAG: hypothetical protein M0R30_06330 [Methanoregula sp.]|jgi:hypothetical protein|uniref:hypothetical protein n=1 Tax=Methanoregula sp. TaxID=2052170 RepID=UPI0026010D5B|nr:hypothetical protein [Methanoregula sp.]MCK9631244.1 hypothetical protein [Methanoregula sp.]
MPAENHGISGTPVSLGEIIGRELSAAETNRRKLLAQREPLALQRGILGLCILTNLLFLVTRNDYIFLFVAASFYLNMFYFITLLIPTNPQAADFKKPEIARFHAWLWENGITSGTRQFTRIFINTFFMNCRTLTFAISLLFSVDIAFTLIAWHAGLPAGITLFVIVQSAIIIIFYAIIGKVEPFTTAFADNIDHVRTRLSRELPPWIISLLFLTGFLIVVFIFLTTIILLPGFTLNMFLTESGLTRLANLFLPLGILAISQYFIIRSIHGNTSRVMAERLMEHREDVLRSLARDAGDSTPGSPESAEQRYEVTSRLLESRIYQVRRNSLLGVFPVYVIDLDFSVMMDSTTLTAIKGYIKERR